MTRQPTIKGVTRRPVSSAFTPALDRAVAHEMRKYNVSRAFVLATCAAYALGVEDQPDYAVEGKTKQIRRKRRR